MAHDPKVQLELHCYEAICEGGTRRVTWLVERDGQWLPVSQLADAELGERESRPGTVWQQYVTIRLPLGSRAMRVERRPEPVRHTDPMDYLFGQQTSARTRLYRQIFVVRAGGSLIREPHGSRTGG